VCVCDVRFAVYPHRLPRCPAMMMSSIRSPNIRRKQSKRQLLANTFSSHPSGCLVQAQKNKNKIKERRISDVFICCHLFFCCCLKYSKDKVNDNRKYYFSGRWRFWCFVAYFLFISLFRLASAGCHLKVNTLSEMF